jgi:ABC-type spermidine/putrescine transport system permease subunit I
LFDPAVVHYCDTVAERHRHLLVVGDVESASRVAVLRGHVIPLTLPGIIGGSLFVFVPSVGAFVTPRFPGRGTVQTIASGVAFALVVATNLGDVIGYVAGTVADDDE